MSAALFFPALPSLGVAAWTTISVVTIVYRLVMAAVVGNFKADFLQSLGDLRRHVPVAAEQGLDFRRPLFTDFLVIVRIDDVLDDVVAARVLGQRLQFL